MTDVYAGRSRNGRMRFSTPTAVREFVHGEHSVTNAGTTLGNAELFSGVRIKADAANAETVFIGSGSGVTTDTRANLDNVGFKLNANEEVFIDIDQLIKVNVMSAGGGETLSFIGS